MTRRKNLTRNRYKREVESKMELLDQAKVLRGQLTAARARATAMQEQYLAEHRRLNEVKEKRSGRKKMKMMVYDDDDEDLLSFSVLWLLFLAPPF